MEITKEQWEIYEKKYGSLIHKICHHINGDLILCNNEDLYQDLCIVALDSIKGFHNKTGQNFEEMIENKLFDQYTKTCLWHKKNNMGARISKRIPFNNKTFSLNLVLNDENKDFVFSYEPSTSFSNGYIDIEDIVNKSETFFNQDTKTILDLLIKENHRKINGKLNISSIVRRTGMTWPKVKLIVKNIENVIGDKL